MDWPFLENVPDQDVKRLISAGHYETHRRGDRVVRQGDPAEVVHLIASGRFGVEVSGAEMEEATLAILGPGDCFGELALADKRAKRSADVRALEPGRTLAIYRRDIESVRKAHPSVDRAVIAILAHEVHRLSDQVVEAYYASAGARVRRRLSTLAEIYGNGAEPIVIPIRQQTLAEMTGVSRQGVNEVLAEEKRKGVLETGRGRIVILEPSLLIESSPTL